jgi:hypothetical protein
MKEYREMKQTIQDIASKILEIEDGYDYSMRGVILDQVVSEYIKLYGVRFAEMFKVVYDSQVDVYDTYGDVDVSVTKLEVVGEYIRYGKRDSYTYSCRAILLEDLCGSSGQFVIIEIGKVSVKYPDDIEMQYHVRVVDEDITEIDVLKYLKVNDNFVVSYQHHSAFGWELLDYTKLLYCYNKFKNMIDTIRRPYWHYTNIDPQD